jgi:hypothetical protein
MSTLRVYKNGKPTTVIQSSLYTYGLQATRDPTYCVTGPADRNPEGKGVAIKYNNFSAYSTSGEKPEWGTAIELRNSMGAVNEVWGNTFSDVVDNLLQYVIASNFLNTHYCSNVFSGFGGWCFEFWGTCTGSKVEANEITGTGYGVVIRPNSEIGEQEHFGNQWSDIVFPGLAYGPVYHAWCLSDPLNSKFIVHTQQSTCNIGSCFYPYHPQRIEPDVMDEFFSIDTLGIPSEGCNFIFTTNQANALDLNIAANAIAVPSNDPAHVWLLKRYLYRKIKDQPTYAQAHSTLPLFMSNQATTSVGKFYDVSKTIYDAWQAQTGIAAQANQLLAQFADLADSLGTLDAVMAQNGPSTSLLQSKTNVLSLMSQHQWQYDSLRGVYETQVIGNLQAAYSLNQAVSGTALFEANEKNVNEIYLLSVMQQGGNLTTAQVASLQNIALQDPRQGGPAVGIALGLLPDCAKPQGLIPYPPMSERAQPAYAQLIEDRERSPLGSKPDRGITVYPNPASTHFVLQNYGNTPGLLSLMDINGRTWLQRKIQGAEQRIELDPGMPKGLYYLRFVPDQGEVLALKLLIQSR